MKMQRVVLTCLLMAVAVVAPAQEELFIRDIVVEGGVTLTVDTVS